MNELTELLERLRQAEKHYKTAKTSLDGSLEYIICKEELKQSRFIWNKACSDYILEHVIKENSDVHEFPNV